MNERVKELAEQAGFGPAWFDESPPGLPALPKEGMLREFAELIVKECLGIYSRIDNGNLHMGTDNYIEAVIKHFGIE